MSGYSGAGWREYRVELSYPGAAGHRGHGYVRATSQADARWRAERKFVATVERVDPVSAPTEPTGDPSPCDTGDHLDIEGGRCLACGEWVFD